MAKESEQTKQTRHLSKQVGRRGASKQATYVSRPVSSRRAKQVSRQFTFRAPEDLAQFVEERAEALRETNTDVIIAALVAAKRQCEIDKERAVYAAAGGDPYVIEPQSNEQIADVWKDLDW